MIKIIIAWMIFSSKLLSSFSLSAIYSFLKYLHYRQTKTSSGNGENMQPSFTVDHLDATYFLTLFDPCLGRDPYFGNQWFSGFRSQSSGNTGGQHETLRLSCL